MARPPRKIVDLSRRYVCVRVVNMAGVDLSVYRFDYDLTFAALLMNADGTTYHRYGTRDHTSATSRLSMESLARVLEGTLEDHAEYSRSPSPPPPAPRRTVEQIPPMARKLQREKVNCFHCHMVNDAEREHAQETGRWSREDTLGMWPLPEKIGWILDRDDQTLVRALSPDSPPGTAGIRPGDRLVRIGGVRVRTQADVSWALENAPRGRGSLPLEWVREGQGPMRGEIELEDGWRRANDLELSWRPSMWGLRPAPGFGGRQLDADALRQEGLPPGTFAIRVGYIVDWGEHAEDGRSARRAGVEKGDVLLSAGGKRDFASELHFQSWFRYTQVPGTTVELELLRGGKRRTVSLPVRP